MAISPSRLRGPEVDVHFPLLVSFARHERCKLQSFPRKRESSLQSSGNALSTGWISAFAGMTGVSEGTPSQMTPGPIFQLTRELLDYRFTLLNLGVYRPFWRYEGDGKSGYRPEQRRPL